MLKKSFPFGLLAVGMMIAPGAAIAGSQVQSSVTSTTVTTVDVGNGNATTIRSRATTDRSQYQLRSFYCGTGNQIQGSVVMNGTTVANIGNRNSTRVVAPSTTIQTQSAVCPPIRHRY